MNRSARLVACLLIALALVVPALRAGAAERIDLPVRGKTIALTVYRPDVAPMAAKGTVIIGSGDVGWVGLAVTIAEFLRDNGYIVVGVNVRQYLSAFTVGRSHLQTDDIPRDYGAMETYLRARDLLKPPVIVSGVSEGAALAILAASSSANHEWMTGVITMGLPASAEIAWRWSDFTSWIMKKNAPEPSFAPGDYIAGVAPLPLVMIQSTKDEYVPEAHYRRLEAAARAPKKLVLIDASNHRFTDRIPELKRQYMAALGWIAIASDSKSKS